MQHTVDTQMEIGILRELMPELLKPSKHTLVSHTAFECALEVMKQAVATRDSNISRPKVWLTKNIIFYFSMFLLTDINKSSFGRHAIEIHLHSKNFKGKT